MKLTKSAALKIALLAVLALNVSWERIELGSSRLALEGVTKESVGGSGTASTAKAGDGKVSESPDNLKAKATGEAPKAVQLDTKPVAVEKPVETKREPVTFQEKLEICGEEYVLHYEQVERGGENTTEVSARRSTHKDWESAISVKKNLVTTIGDHKTAVQKKISAVVKADRENAKEACADPAAEKAVGDKAAKEAAEEKAEKAEKAKVLADDVKNCKVDREGNPLDRGEKISCLTAAIDHVDKRVEKRKNGKLLSESEEKRAVLAEVTKLYKELKSALRAELLPARKTRIGSRFGKRGDEIDYQDDDRTEAIADAHEDVEAAIEALRGIESQYDLDRTTDRSGRRSSRRSKGPIDKMVGELESMLRGAEISEKNETRITDLKDVRDDMNFYSREAYNNPMDPMAAMNYRQASMDYVNMRGEIERAMNESNRELRSLQSYMDRGDFREFSRSTEDLQRLLRENINANGNRTGVGSNFSGPITNATVPNLAAMRFNAATGVNGFPATAPVLNLQTPNYQTPGLLPTTAFGNNSGLPARR